MQYEKRPINIKEWEMYQVDTEGNIYNKHNHKLKYSINHNGYCIVNLYQNQKRKGFSVHTLVAKTFLSDSYFPNAQVNHKDGNKQNNNVDNLEWVTALDNMNHAINILGYNKIGKNNPMAKAVIGIDKKTNEIKYQFDSLADAARFFVKPNHNYRHIQNCIWCVIHGHKKSYQGCIWRFLN